MKDNKQRCEGMLWNNIERCWNRGWIERGGKFYCKVHDPLKKIKVSTFPIDRVANILRQHTDSKGVAFSRIAEMIQEEVEGKV